MRLRRPRCADCRRRLRGYEYLTFRGIICGPCYRLARALQVAAEIARERSMTLDEAREALWGPRPESR